MQERVKKPKRAVNLSVDVELLNVAKASGTNLSALLEKALQDEFRATEWLAWREENRAAIEASNRELAENGLWADAYRVW